MKIVLHNSETGKLESFEPVDAREILADENTIYTVPQETTDAIGARMDLGKMADGAKVNVAQLQGDDAEMQTGLSIDKYGRGNVVQAMPGVAGEEQRKQVLTTGGQYRSPTDPTAAGRPGGTTSDNMTSAQLKSALDAKKIEYPADARKADLQKLFDAQP